MRHDDTLADLSAELPVRAQAHVGLQLLWLAEAWERLSTEESLQAYLSRQQRLVDGVDSWDVAAMRTLRSEILRAGYLAMRSGESVAPEVGGVEHLTLVQLGVAELVTGDSTSLAQALLGLTGLDAANPVAIPWRDEVAAALRAAQQGAGAEAVREALRPVRQRMEQVLPAWLEDRRRYLAPMSRGSGADPYAAVAAASQASPTTMLGTGAHVGGRAGRSGAGASRLRHVPPPPCAATCSANRVACGPVTSSNACGAWCSEPRRPGPSAPATCARCWSPSTSS